MCLGELTAISYWVKALFVYILGGLSFTLYACFLEGKRVPNFPVCLCRRTREAQSRQSTGLQFTSTLGKALKQLKKYDLDKQRQKDFPVEAAAECLLSTSTLMVADAPDMDLASSIDYFLDHSSAEEGVSIANMLRSPTCEGAYDIPSLRRTVDRCLQWAQDPETNFAVGMTANEAAAIQLYTQPTCLYPQLNSALRNHLHPEALHPFLPYMKLLLTGLNKLPLIRARVYRGINLDLHELYSQLQGKVVTWWSFSSTTLRNDLAVFLGDDESTSFCIDAIGVDIAAFSAFPAEKEVLLLPGTTLMVRSGVEVEPNRWSFEASVFKVAQPAVAEERNGDDQHEDHNDNDDDVDELNEEIDDQDEVERGQQKGCKPENRGIKGVSEPVSKVQFQNTDLAHPEWSSV